MFKPIKNMLLLHFRQLLLGCYEALLKLFPLFPFLKLTEEVPLRNLHQSRMCFAMSVLLSLPCIFITRTISRKLKTSATDGKCYCNIIIPRIIQLTKLSNSTVKKKHLINDIIHLWTKRPSLSGYFFLCFFTCVSLRHKIPPPISFLSRTKVS